MWGKARQSSTPLGYPAGHLGHLDEKQQTALNEFKELCQEKGYYKPADSSSYAIKQADDVLLRFLRARSFDVKGALRQLEGRETWIKDNHLADVYDNIALGELEGLGQMYPRWSGRRDKNGFPLYIFNIRETTPERLATFTTEESKWPTAAHREKKVKAQTIRLYAQCELDINFVQPLCSAFTDRPYPDTPISQATTIIDMSGMGLRLFWQIRPLVQELSYMAESYYPETSGPTFIVGAPGFFPTIWNLIKSWLDPGTVAKIFIISASQVTSTLEKYIDPENIPVQYGGKFEYEVGQAPDLDAGIAKQLVAAQSMNGDSQGPEVILPLGPIKLVRGPEGLEAVAVGTSDDGTPRNKKLFVVKEAKPDVPAQTTELGSQGATVIEQ